MNKIALGLAAVAASASVWIGGELHRSNCVDAGRTGCSVLAWKDGKPRPHRPDSNLTGASLTGGSNIR